jgi:hypothetical protein
MLKNYFNIILISAGVAVGTAGTLYITKAVKPEIVVKTEKVLAPQCPPCNGIDYDKIKSKNLTIQNTQYLTVSGDSALKENLEASCRKILQEELSKLKVSKCK